MIALEGVSVSIGHIAILHDVTLQAEAGRMVAVIGANGAGKTTLLRAISGLLPLRSGRIRFDGQDITGRPAPGLARSGLVHVPQGRQVVPNLSVRDNLLIGARQIADRGDIGQRLEREFARFPILRERALLPAGALSGGEQQMLAISRGLMMRPRLLMLDEPSLGLAPRMVDFIMQALAALRDEGLTMLLVEQMARAALAVADTALVLRRGRVVLSGPAAPLRHDRALVASYLS
jgi:branched-chain amino acid transport system ATP-binding protein